MVERQKKDNLALQGSVDELAAELRSVNTLSECMRRTIDELRKQSVDAFEALKRMLGLYDKHSGLGLKQRLQKDVNFCEKFKKLKFLKFKKNEFLSKKKEFLRETVSFDIFLDLSSLNFEP